VAEKGSGIKSDDQIFRAYPRSQAAANLKQLPGVRYLERSYSCFLPISPTLKKSAAIRNLIS